jgi:RimJ/RimL family protein N-acetyltransferase
LSDLRIHRIGSEDLSEVKQLLTSDRPGYGQYFQAWDMSHDAWASMISGARMDGYWGMRIDRTMAGLFMLRGLDAGYKAPAYGIYVAEAFSGKGLAKLSLCFAVAWCLINAHEEIMLTVHPDHTRARALYENAGFRFYGEHSGMGHCIMRKRLAGSGVSNG